MVARLLFDLIRRRWIGIAFLTFQVYSMCRSFWGNSTRLDVESAFMGGALLLSLPAYQAFEVRELYQLPVSRRTMWVVRWWASVVAPSFVASSAVLFAMWSQRPDQLSLDGAVLSFMYAVLYCGCLADFYTKLMAGYGEEPATIRSVVIGTPVMLGVLAAPFFLGSRLPHTVMTIGPITAIGMLIAAFMTIRGFSFEPPIVARLSRRAPRAVQSDGRPLPTLEPETAREIRRTMPLWRRLTLRVLALGEKPRGGARADRLEGLSLLLWLEIRRRFIGVCTALAAAAVGWAVMSTLRPVPSLPEAFIRTALLPFAERRLDLAFPPMACLLVVVLMGDLPAGSMNLVLLRPLPLPTWRVALMPIATGVSTAAMIYIIQVSLYVLTGPVQVLTWRIDVFVVAAAALAMAYVLRMASIGGGALVVFALLFAIPLFRTDLDLIVPQSTYLLGGLALLAVTVVTSWYLVAHNGYGYRRARVQSAARAVIAQI